ncbi:MAG: hypothetical protein KDA75_08345, partial [Planctomycetaceae bacterium]|nr:hypothetical protein [Planctomycetaceae bacterium]
EYRGSSLAAVVVFTDGIASAGEETRLSRAAPRARDVGVPLYPVAVGSRDPVKDLELYDLLADDVAFLGEPVTLRVRHRSFGLRGQTTTLKLFVEGNSEPLLTREVAAGPDGVSEQVEVTATLPEEGTYQLNLVSAPLPDEVNIANNVVRHRVEVRREQLRVLMVEGMPRWEYRALKPVLERDDTLQLATFLQSADLDFTAEDQTALRGFPITQEELNQYDAIVWGDVDLSALDRRVPERLRSFVGEHGGGLILVAGEQHNPLSYVGTELETLLPVSLSGRGAMSEDMLRNLPRFRLQRTLEGKSRAFLRLADDPAEDDAVWQRLPEEIDWLVPTPLTKPGGQVLAVGPVLVETGEPAPVIVQQRYGQGQVVYHASDSLWTWRRRVEDRYYGRYWSQALRELTAGTRRRTQADVELTSDRQVYAPGDDVQLRLRGTSTTNAAWGNAVNVVVESSAGERFASRLQRRPDGAPVWEGAVQRLPLGEFRAKSGGVTADEPGAVCSFRVEAPDYELRERAAAIQDLQQAARISHGAFHSFADADRVPGNLPRGRSIKLAESRPIPLWNRWEPLLLLIGLLSAEWMLRKRARLV